MPRKNTQRNEAFNNAAKRIESWGLSTHAMVVFFILLVISARLFVRDVETSMWGYQLFPTNKGGGWDIPIFVALFFPFMQIGATYMAIALGKDSDKTNDKLALFFVGLVFIGMSFDVITDVMFRVHDNLSAATVAVGLFETIFIYTIGSEVTLTVSFTMLIALIALRLRVRRNPLHMQQQQQQQTNKPKQQRRQNKNNSNMPPEFANIINNPRPTNVPQRDNR